MKTILGWVFGIAMGALVGGCGGNDSSGSNCGDTSACGGDITGSWKVSSACLTLNQTSMMTDMNCPDLKTDTPKLNVSGTATYNSDKTYQANLTFSGSFNMTFPASCLTVSGITLTCDQVAQSINSKAGTSNISSASCKAAGTGCSCAITLDSSMSNTNGMWSTSGGVLTETETGGTPEDSNFCVKGSTLTISSTGNSKAITGSIVLTK